ncbi:heme NO-binding domain-containing protein [Pseudaestuariivita rosea]|uniref:heme NO-binding domain-containing protein n=1 Tax=Pseudaestuariivita rosea TaxID=2763263 RepID=UPI001ABBA6F2|nr:heme NO-binding domain-containing protein [Pseudaestuariivita rosea]
MHGLVNRAIEKFVCDTYGMESWRNVVRKSAIGIDTFEAMLSYESIITSKLLTALSSYLDKPPGDILEDIGMYLVSHPNCEALRRLMRFGGETFEEFLYSLEDLSDRASLAVPDLLLPDIELIEETKGDYDLAITDSKVGFGYVLVGVLRAMADDYGALVFLEHKGHHKNSESLSVRLFDDGFSEGRSFQLTQAAGA